MSDIAVTYYPDTMTFDWSITAPGLTPDDGLETAVIISLFSDRRARDEDEIPGGDDNRRGWWADAYAEVDGDKWGSRLWLLSRSKQMASVLRKYEDYAAESLKWMVDDGVVQAIKCTAEIVRDGVMGLAVAMTKGKNTATKYQFTIFWEGI